MDLMLFKCQRYSSLNHYQGMPVTHSLDSLAIHPYWPLLLVSLLDGV